MIIIPYILSFAPPKERIKEKLSGCNKTAKNLLEAASLDKLLASLVNRGNYFFVAASELGEAKQYLRSSFSYGFINAVFCNAGKKTGYPALSVSNLPHCEVINIRKLVHAELRRKKAEFADKK